MDSDIATSHLDATPARPASIASPTRQLQRETQRVASAFQADERLLPPAARLRLRSLLPANQTDTPT
ncbi:MAG: hypothetical protein QM679_03475 [Patulibacter sp.]